MSKFKMKLRNECLMCGTENKKLREENAELEECLKTTDFLAKMSYEKIVEQRDKLREENASLKESVLAEHQAAVDMFAKYDSLRDENERMKVVIDAARYFAEEARTKSEKGAGLLSILEALQVLDEKESE